MLLDVISAEYINEYKIKLTFENGQTGIVDFSDYLSRGGIFSKFKDMDFFKSFQLNSEIGNIIWNNEIDIAPEVLYARAMHVSLPEWMSH